MIPYIDILTKHVDDWSEDQNQLPVIRAAAKRGRIILDKYYEKTDETVIYRVAMSTPSPLWPCL